MKKIIICTNTQRDPDFKYTGYIADILQRNNAEYCICPLFYNRSILETQYHFSNLEESLPDASAVITLGGDGTILRVARIVASYNVPILPVNLGDMGFIAEISPSEFERYSDLSKLEYTIQKRMMLDYSLIRDNAIISSGYALNDVVIKGLTKMIDLEVLGDGFDLAEFIGDGAVIATPTGSTAYSMSAGGPIVEPDAKNIIVTPICPHSLTVKSYVLSPSRNVSVILGKRKQNPAYLSVDGDEAIELLCGDIININVSKTETSLVLMANNNFYKKVYEKLGEKR